MVEKQVDRGRKGLQGRELKLNVGKKHRRGRPHLFVADEKQ